MTQYAHYAYQLGLSILSSYEQFLKYKVTLSTSELDEFRFMMAHPSTFINSICPDLIEGLEAGIIAANAKSKMNDMWRMACMNRMDDTWLLEELSS
jgi:hypothetical protein